MRSVLRALWDGLILRCPRCHQGRMFDHGMHMRGECPVCGLPFERSSGEITGGMCINACLTQSIVFVLGAVAGWYAWIWLGPLLLLLVAISIAIPIAFYKPSRGLWASIIYLTGDNEEPD